MKKFALIFIGLVLVALISYWYSSKPKDVITGSWQLKKLKINGTVLEGKTLGNWVWNFTNNHNYLFTVGNTKEIGTYKIADNKLTLKSITYAKRPEQILLINQLDSLEMNLVSTDDKNKSSLHFAKAKK